MKLSNEAKVGALLVVAIALLILGFNLLKGNAVFSSSTTLYAKYHDVDGLAEANPIRVNGLKVGSVNNLEVMNEHAGTILAKLTITSKINIPSNSVAQIVNSDLLGSKAIVINFGDANTYLQDNDTIAGEVKKPMTEKLTSEIAPLSEKIQVVLENLDSVLTDVHSTLDSKTQKDLRSSIASLSQTMNNFAATSAKLDKLVNNFNSFMGNINDQNDKINSILANTEKATSSLTEADIPGTVAKLDQAVDNLNGILTRVNEGKGSLGLFMNDNHLYNNLKSATYNMNLLMEDLRLNPKRYVHFSIFGKKSAPAALPSDTLMK